MFQTKTEQMIQPVLLIQRQAAKFLAISEKTLYNLTRCGQIPVVRIGKRGVRYDPADLRAWVERSKSTSAWRVPA
jgi:excisionase family DNA binding protein